MSRSGLLRSFVGFLFIFISLFACNSLTLCLFSTFLLASLRFFDQSGRFYALIFRHDYPVFLARHQLLDGIR